MIGIVNLLEGMQITAFESYKSKWKISGYLKENDCVEVTILFTAHYPTHLDNLFKIGGLISVRFDILVDGYKGAFGYISSDEMVDVANYFACKSEQTKRANIENAYDQIKHLLKP